MNIPSLPPLQAGDKVAVVAPAKKTNPTDLRDGIALLRSWGLQVEEATHLYSAHFQFAGTDTQRLSDFQQAISDPSVKAIFCARGGYGTLRILDAIDFSPLHQHPKWIVGYSDITAVHAHLSTQYGLPSLHATMPLNMGNNSPEALQSLQKALWGESLSYRVESHPLSRVGKAEGILFGGNLSLIYAMQGSASLPNPEGKILFLEDVGEYLYHLDRMMISLKRSGLLRDLAGLVLGGFTQMQDNADPFGMTAEEIIRSHVENYAYPVCMGFPAGHIPDNRALIMGAPARLEVTSVESRLVSGSKDFPFEL